MVVSRSDIFLVLCSLYGAELDMGLLTDPTYGYY